MAGLRASGISYRGAIRFESPLSCMPPVSASEYQLPVGEPVRVLTAALDQRVDQGVSVAGVHPGYVADLISRVTHRSHRG